MKIFSFKETGIIIGYLTLLVGIIYFDWRPFGLFLSFIIEYLVILLIYVFLSLHRGVSKRRDEPLLLTVLVTGLAMGSLNLAFGKTLVFEIITSTDRRIETENIWWTVLAIILPMFLLHALSVRSRWISPQLMDKQRSLIFTGVIALSAMNVAGLVAWSSYGYGDPIAVIVTMVIIRIISEVWMNHFQKIG